VAYITAIFVRFTLAEWNFVDFSKWISWKSVNKYGKSVKIHYYQSAQYNCHWADLYETNDFLTIFFSENSKTKFHENLWCWVTSRQVRYPAKAFIWVYKQCLITKEHPFHSSDRVRGTDTKCVCTCSKFQERTDKSSNISHCYNGLH
jgi:hypothetical protein